MLILAVFLLTIGSIGEVAAVIMEIKAREPVYALLMKIFPWFFGMGAVMLSLNMP